MEHLGQIGLNLQGLLLKGGQTSGLTCVQDLRIKREIIAVSLAVLRGKGAERRAVMFRVLQLRKLPPHKATALTLRPGEYASS